MANASLMHWQVCIRTLENLSEKRQLQAEKFEHDSQWAQAQRQLTLANVQRDTALAWLEHHYTQALRELVQKQIEETRLQVQAADIAFRINRGSQADVFAARAAIITLQDRLSQIDRQSRSAALLLTRWAGGSKAERPPTAGPPPWQSTAMDGDMLSKHIKKHPALVAGNAEIDAAETETPSGSSQQEIQHQRRGKLCPARSRFLEPALHRGSYFFAAGPEKSSSA